jgi:hypothetical protein
MGTLTMALAAALLAGSGPEKVSGETVQRVDLRGAWSGTWQDWDGSHRNATLYNDGVQYPSERGLTGKSAGDDHILFIPVDWIVDDGNGRFHILHWGQLGVCEIQGDQLSLCFGPASRGYPRALQGGSGQNLILLHRSRGCE